MNTNQDQDQQPDRAAGPSDHAASPSPELLARRRVLLKALGKGSAVIAAAVPLQTLATSTVLTNSGHLCAQSGAISAVRSVVAGIPVCGGYSPITYTDKSKWPGATWSATSGWTASANCGGKTVHTGACKFKDVFGSGTSTTCYDVLIATGTSYAQEKVWISALLNAKKYEALASMNFPYTCSEVLAQFDGSNKSAYHDFYKTHLQAM